MAVSRHCPSQLTSFHGVHEQILQGNTANSSSYQRWPLPISYVMTSSNNYLTPLMWLLCWFTALAWHILLSSPPRVQRSRQHMGIISLFPHAIPCHTSRAVRCWGQPTMENLLSPEREESAAVHASFVWNNLPRHLQNDKISREQFARDLKTFLFARAYSSEAPLRTSA